MLHRFFAITCLIVISTRSFVTSNNVTGASTKPSTTSPTTTLTTTVIIQTSSTTRQTATTKTANTTIQTNTTTTTTVAPKIKDKVSGASIIQSSEEPDFEDALKSDEQRTGYYKFVKKGNDSDVVISSRVNLKKKKIEISDIDKRYATFSVTATNYQDANKQLITFMSKLLNVKEDQVSIKSGISSNEKILKITDYKRSRYRVLYKMVQAWESAQLQNYEKFNNDEKDDESDPPYKAPCGRDTDCAACSLSQSTKDMYEEFGRENVRDLSKII